MNSACPTPMSIRMALNRTKGSRGCGFESLQKALEARETRLEARPGVQYL